MRVFTSLVLLLFFLLGAVVHVGFAGSRLLHGKRTSNNNNLATAVHHHHQDADEVDLPECQQREKRVLVCITIGWKEGRQAYLAKQLESYVNLCESGGYEVHVVLVTFVSWTDNHAGVYTKSRYLCRRLGVDVAVVVKRFANVSQVGHKLAAMHRHVFAEKRADYDLFISQEDDMMVQQAHVHYFDKWSKAFRGTPLYPSFMIMEVPTSLYHAAALYHNAPMIWRSFVAQESFYRKLHLFRFQGGADDKLVDAIMVMHGKAWTPMYMLTREMLTNCTSTPAWLQDENKPWKEYNVHFQHLFLPRYFQVVIPLQDFAIAFVHHAPNRYINDDLNKTQQQLQQQQQASVPLHNYAVETREIEALLAQCSNATSAARSI